MESSDSASHGHDDILPMPPRREARNQRRMQVAVQCLIERRAPIVANPVERYLRNPGIERRGDQRADARYSACAYSHRGRIDAPTHHKQSTPRITSAARMPGGFREPISGEAEYGIHRHFRGARVSLSSSDSAEPRLLEQCKFPAQWIAAAPRQECFAEDAPRFAACSPGRRGT